MMFETSPKISTGRWLVVSGTLFVGLLAAALLLVMMLNGSTVNRMFSPLSEFLPIYRLVSQEHPLGALWLIGDKSLFAFAHLDGRSGLNHWTLEFNALSLGVYLLAALLAGRALVNGSRRGFRQVGALFAAVAGVLFSATYVTSIAHCSGPTWAGFVALYGLGFEEVDTAVPYWQYLLGLPSLAALVPMIRRREEWPATRRSPGRR